MKFEPYMLCPCGSGKGLKWCCGDTYPQFFKAIGMIESGQPESGIRLVEELLKKHPNDPRVKIYAARAYYYVQNLIRSEELTVDALKIAPKLPSALLMKAMMLSRQQKLAEAIEVLHEAADYFPEKQSDSLKIVWGMIADFEYHRANFPAAKLAFIKQLEHDPLDEKRKETFEAYFVNEEGVPQFVLADYSYQPGTIAPPSTNKLLSAENLFAKHLEQNPNDQAARFNLALTRLWLGKCAEAIREFEIYQDLESDPVRAAEAGCLREVASEVFGFEDYCDHLSYIYHYQIVDGEKLGQTVQKLLAENRLGVVGRSEESGAVALTYFRPETIIDPTHPPKSRLPFCNIHLVPGQVILEHMNRENVETTKKELDAILGFSVEKPEFEQRFDRWQNTFNQLIPVTNENLPPSEFVILVRDSLIKYLEEQWYHKPLKSLGGLSPEQAQQDPKKKNRLEGLVQYLEYVAIVTFFNTNRLIRDVALERLPYDFNRLRRKLGITHKQIIASGDQATEIETLDLGAVTELAKSETVPSRLVKLFDSAIRFQDFDLAGRLGEKIIALPPEQEPRDRSNYYISIMNAAFRQQKFEEAVRWAEEGQKHVAIVADPSTQIDFMTRKLKCQLMMKKKEGIDEEMQSYDAEWPQHLELLAGVTETLLSNGAPDLALKYAEYGTRLAQKALKRSLENGFQEMAAEARKQLAKS